MPEDFKLEVDGKPLPPDTTKRVKEALKKTLHEELARVRPTHEEGIFASGHGSGSTAIST